MGSRSRSRSPIHHTNPARDSSSPCWASNRTQNRGYSASSSATAPTALSSTNKVVPEASEGAMGNAEGAGMMPGAIGMLPVMGAGCGMPFLPGMLCGTGGLVGGAGDMGWLSMANMAAMMNCMASMPSMPSMPSIAGPAGLTTMPGMGAMLGPMVGPMGGFMPMMGGMIGGMMGGMGGMVPMNTMGAADQSQMFGFAAGSEQEQQAYAKAMAAIKAGAVRPTAALEEDVTYGGTSVPRTSPDHHAYRPPNTEPISGVTEKRWEGYIRLFIEDKLHGYGFIKSTELRKKIPDKDIFLHRNQRNGFKQGDTVTFSVFMNFRGMPQATDLRRPRQRARGELSEEDDE